MKKILLLFILLSTFAQAEIPRVRPAKWAQPIIATDLENWHQIDDKVFRSSQPDADDMPLLQQLNITDILNLRSIHTDNDEAKNTSIKLHHIKTNAGDISPDEIVQALKIITTTKGRILVHCWHGSDRTGAVIASYRIVVQGWNKEEAIDEMVNGGYGFHAIFGNIVPTIKGLEVDKIRKDLNIKRHF